MTIKVAHFALSNPVIYYRCDAQNFTIIIGYGPALGKVVSLAEIVKRKSKCDLLQANSIRFTTEGIIVQKKSKGASINYVETSKETDGLSKNRDIHYNNVFKKDRHCQISRFLTTYLMDVP